ncbi:MAG: hypothetical protein IPI67_24245 [Myxococcales bacterium]|nr:hypothetical protein [Myxococcales bacterium]
MPTSTPARDRSEREPDINSHFQVKASASNILNAPHLVTQGADHDAPVVSKYTSGSVVSVGATYTY